MAFRREFFRRGDTFVAVKYIRLTSKERLEPGTVIKPGDFRLYQKMNWWRRRQIGVQGSDWVAAQLGLDKPKQEKAPPKLSELEPYKRDAKWVIPGYEDSVSFKTKKAAQQWLAEEQQRTDGAQAAAVAGGDQEPIDTDEHVGEADGIEKEPIEGDQLEDEGDDEGEGE